MLLHVSPTCLRLSPTCLPLDSGCFARMILHPSPTCLRLSPTMLWMLGPRDFTFVSHLSPLVLCPHDLNMSPTCLRVSPTRLPLDSGCSARMFLHVHLSPLVSHLSPTRLWMLCPHDFTSVSYLSPLVSQCTLDALSALVRMISHLSHTCLPAVPHYNVDSARMISGLSSTCPSLSLHSGFSAA